MEIDWWLAHRGTAPILVDPLMEGLRYVPVAIARRWPDIQRIPLVEAEWSVLSGAALEAKTEAVRRQVIGAILPSGAAIYAQELAIEQQRSRRLKGALLIAALLLVAVGAAGAYAYNRRGAAQRSERVAQASLLDSTASSLFNEARLLETRRELEMNRAGDLVARAALIASTVPPADAAASVDVLRENLGTETAQLKADIAALKRRSAEALARGREALRRADTAWQDLAAIGAPIPNRQSPEPFIFSIELVNAGRGESLLCTRDTRRCRS